MSCVVTVYTVRRVPRTAAAKSSAGYDAREFEYVADDASSAIAAAVAECPWRDAERNFWFDAVGSRVVVPESADTGRAE